jgi:predicted transcriptional regulator
MEHSITLSEQTYRALQRQAARSHKAVEALVEEWLQERLPAADLEELKPWLGRDLGPIEYKESTAKPQVLRETTAASQETVTMELPSEIYDGLQQLADQDQIDLVRELDCLVKRALLLQVRDASAQERPASTEPDPLRQIAAMAQDLGVDDLAEQHDHYLYGTEKR